MGTRVRLSTKGQIVIPKDVRDALGLEPGEQFDVSHQGRRIVLDAVAEKRPRISYEEFRRRVPGHEGSAVSIEDMTAGIGELFRDWKV